MHKNFYFEVRKDYPLLVGSDEKRVAIGAKANGGKDRDTFILSNIGLVFLIAKKYARNGDLGDIVHQGIIGLVKAVDKFDPGRYSHLSPYASKAIENDIRKYLAKKQKDDQKDAKTISLSQPAQAFQGEPMEHYIPDEQESHEERIFRNDKKQVMEEALGRLGRKYKRLEMMIRVEWGGRIRQA